MTDRAEHVKDVFLRALELPVEERSAYLAGACAGDETLRSEVNGLLAALAQASGFLGEAAAAAEAPGMVLGRYRLGERIGEGGFGVVHRAEQLEPVKRTVAIKIVKRGMDTQRVLARFAQEQQALARMQHPQIATVLDGGTTPSGRPYFVMEFVDGLPITRFCRERRVGLTGRLQLMRQVCLAVQHAHHKGVVHRDLKPGNILVGIDPDGVLTPKVIDFGIAKAMDVDGDATLTLQGQPLGTLEYMAPEQATGDVDVDARADIYSLGVVTYELLTAERPIERGGTGHQSFAAMLQRIRSEIPARPSSRVTAAHLDGVPETERARWARRLRGDIDQVVLRALAKEPAQRYATPTAFADDLQNLLAGRPVAASPRTPLQQLRSFVLRHRLAVAASAMLLVALLTGIVTTANALTDSRRESAQKQATLSALQELLQTADPARLKGQGYTVRQQLDDFARQLDERFSGDPTVARELHLTIAAAYRNLGRIADADRHVAQALTLADAAAGDGAFRIRALLERAQLQRELGDHDALAATVAQGREAVRAAGGDRGPAIRFQLLWAEVHRLRGETAAGEALAQAMLAQLGAMPPTSASANDRAMALDLLGAFAMARGHGRDALRRHQEAFEVRRATFGADSMLTASSWANLAEDHRQLGDLDAAQDAADTALRLQLLASGEEHLAVARTVSLLGGIARQRRDLEAADRHFRHAQDIRARLLPEHHALLARGLADRAHVAIDAGRHADAEALLRQALRQLGTPGPATHAHAAMLQNLGVAVSQLGRSAEAESWYRDALAMHRRTGGDGNPAVADCLFNLGMLRHVLGHPQDALELYREALALRRRHRPDHLAALRASLHGVMRAATALGDLATAARAEAEVAELATRDASATPQQIMASRAHAAQLFLDAGLHGEAEPLLAIARTWSETNLPEKWPHGEVLSLLAECQLASGRPGDALPLAEGALRLFATSPPPEDRLFRAQDTLERARSALPAHKERPR